jgi:hypothetical protein
MKINDQLKRGPCGETHGKEASNFVYSNWRFRSDFTADYVCLFLIRVKKISGFDSGFDPIQHFLTSRLPFLSRIRPFTSASPSTPENPMSISAPMDRARQQEPSRRSLGLKRQDFSMIPGTAPVLYACFVRLGIGYWIRQAATKDEAVTKDEMATRSTL